MISNPHIAKFCSYFSVFLLDILGAFNRVNHYFLLETFSTWLLGCHFLLFFLSCMPFLFSFLYWPLVLQLLNVGVPQCSVPGKSPLLALYTPFPGDLIQFCGFRSMHVLSPTSISPAFASPVKLPNYLHNTSIWMSNSMF